MDDNCRWPGLCISIFEESYGDGGDGRLVDGCLRFEYLEVDEIVSPVVAAGSGIERRAGVELLRDLVFDGQQRDGLWCVEADRREQVHDFGSELEVVVFGAADLVVSEFKRDAQPVSPEVCEANLEGLHHVLLGHVVGLRRVELFECSGESAPSGLEVSAQFVEVVAECDSARTVGQYRDVRAGRVENLVDGR